MYGSFWYDVGVESVAEVDRINVIAVAQEPLLARPYSFGQSKDVPLQIAVHDGEEDLQKQIDRIQQYR